MFDDFAVTYSNFDMFWCEKHDCTLAHFIGYAMDRLEGFACARCRQNEQCCVVLPSGERCECRPLNNIELECVNDGLVYGYSHNLLLNSLVGDKIMKRALTGEMSSRKFVCTAGCGSFDEHTCKKHNGNMYKARVNINISMAPHGNVVYHDMTRTRWDSPLMTTRFNMPLLMQHVKLTSPTHEFMTGCRMIIGDKGAWLRVPKNAHYLTPTNYLVKLIPL